MIARPPTAPCLLALLLAAWPIAADAQGIYPAPASSGSTFASSETKAGDARILEGVGFDQRLGERIPLTLDFRDEAGKAVTLADYFARGKPVILNMVYYECPMLCNLELNGLCRALKVVDLGAGDQFEIVTVSINPDEEPGLAAAKKAGYLKRYGREGAGVGWHFLTGETPQIDALAEAIGFRYRYDEASGLYAHNAGIVVLTPDGTIAYYFFGVEFSPRDVKFALMSASERQIGSPIDQALLYCYHYDPATGQYTLAVQGALKLLGLATILALVGSIAAMVLRDRRKAPAEAGATAPTTTP